MCSRDGVYLCLSECVAACSAESEVRAEEANELVAALKRRDAARSNTQVRIASQHNACCGCPRQNKQSLVLSKSRCRTPLRAQAAVVSHLGM